MIPHKLTLTCTICRKSQVFDASDNYGASEAQVEGWMQLDSREYGTNTPSLLATLCPRCFADLQFRYAPSTLSFLDAPPLDLRAS
jgi:hypothetical protein